MAETTDPNASGAPAAPAAPYNPTTKPTESGPAAGVPAADVQRQINQALQTQQAEFAKQLKEATGHSDLKTLTEAQLLQQGDLQALADTRAVEAETYKSKYQLEAVGNALLAASSEAIDPKTVKDLLFAKGVVDDKGNISIDGKPVADAVKALLEERPFLAKAQGDTGSGAPQNAGSAVKNPWSKEHFNLTEQSRIYQQDPAQAEKLKAQAAA